MSAVDVARPLAVPHLVKAIPQMPEIDEVRLPATPPRKRTIRNYSGAGARVHHHCAGRSAPAWLLAPTGKGASVGGHSAPEPSRADLRAGQLLSPGFARPRGPLPSPELSGRYGGIRPATRTVGPQRKRRSMPLRALRSLPLASDHLEQAIAQRREPDDRHRGPPQAPQRRRRPRAARCRCSPTRPQWIDFELGG